MDSAHIANDPRLDAAEKLVTKYVCRCGSGGPLACDDDCEGDTTHPNVKEAILIVIQILREIRDETKDSI